MARWYLFIYSIFYSFIHLFIYLFIATLFLTFQLTCFICNNLLHLICKAKPSSDRCHPAVRPAPPEPIPPQPFPGFARRHFQTVPLTSTVPGLWFCPINAADPPTWHPCSRATRDASFIYTSPWTLYTLRCMAQMRAGLSRAIYSTGKMARLGTQNSSIDYDNMMMLCYIEKLLWAKHRALDI